MGELLLSFPLCRWKVWVLERFSNIAKCTALILGRAEGSLFCQQRPAIGAVQGPWLSSSCPWSPPPFSAGGFPLLVSPAGGCVDAATGLVSTDVGEQLGNYFQKYWLVMGRKLFSMPPISRKLPLVLTFHQPHNVNWCKCIIRNNSLGKFTLIYKIGLVKLKWELTTSISLLKHVRCFACLALQEPHISGCLCASLALQGDPGEGIPSEEARTPPVQKVAL